jgi:hypothetical protein
MAGNPLSPQLSPRDHHTAITIAKTKETAASTKKMQIPNHRTPSAHLAPTERRENCSPHVRHLNSSGIDSLNSHPVLGAKSVSHFSGEGIRRPLDLTS